jgi:hypothetical protein
VIAAGQARRGLGIQVRIKHGADFIDQLMGFC